MMRESKEWRTEGQMESNPLKIAQSEIGNTESPAGSNRTPYGDWYGLDGQPWCMMFVQWCFSQAGHPLPYKTASCSQLLQWYQKYQPERVSKEPRANDIVIYNFGHTGIVESATAETITAIEGNTSPSNKGSQDNGGGVYRRVRKKVLADAYIRPFDNYEEETMTGEEIFNALNSYLKTQPVPAWAKEEWEEAVKLGITDGKEPMALIPRYQAAIMSKRTREDAK
jgi:hypothetical protein